MTMIDEQQAAEQLDVGQLEDALDGLEGRIGATAERLGAPFCAIESIDHLERALVSLIEAKRVARDALHELERYNLGLSRARMSAGRS